MWLLNVQLIRTYVWFVHSISWLKKSAQLPISYSRIGDATLDAKYVALEDTKEL